MRRALQAVTWSGTTIAIGLLIWSFAAGFELVPTLILLTAAGLAVGAALAEIYFRDPKPIRAFAIFGLGFIAASQLFYYMLVWGEAWRTQQLGWRLWWATMIPALNCAHLLILARAGARWESRWTRATAGCIVALGVVLMGLMLRENFLDDLHPALQALIAIPAAGAVLGSIAAAARWYRAHPRRTDPMPRPLRWAIAIAFQIVLFLGGFYAGRKSVPPPSPFDLLPSALAGLEPAELSRQVDQDFARLRTIAGTVDELKASVLATHHEIAKAMERDGRTYFTQSEDDRIRWHFVTYLSLRSALMRMVAMYAGFESVKEPELKARCFLLGYGSAATAFETAIFLVKQYRDNASMRAKLNEPDAAWDLKAGSFDDIYYSVTASRNNEIFGEFSEYFKHRDWSAVPEAELAFIRDRVDGADKAIQEAGLSHTRALFSRILNEVKKDTYTPVYNVQSMVSSMIGDIRIATREPFITPETIEQVRGRLQPGDILIERRNWFLSNAFLPGFWPHAALYVGSPADLEALGIADHPEVRNKWEAYARDDAEGHPHAVIEAVGEGVLFTSLEHSIHCDYLAVFRPKLSRDQIAQVIVNAFRHQGKPYDFEFDFQTSDKLVCTELVYRAVADMIRLDLVEIMGRRTLPALEIVRKFRNELGRPDAELEFVLFLDVAPGADRATDSTPEALCGSVDRPREFND